MLADSTAAAWMRGAGRVVRDLPGTAPQPAEDTPLAATPAIEWTGMKAWLPAVESAAADLQTRQILLKQDFDNLHAEARRQAFTVAGVNTEEAIGKVRDAVTQAVVQGHGIEQFKSTIDDALGTSTLGIGHLDNVLRTNVAQAYAAGQEDIHSHPLVADLFPYVETIPIRDSRETDLCAIISRSGLDGTGVFRVSDPVWIKFRPPRHWRCRCAQNFLRVEQAAAKGVREAQEWLRTGQPPAVPEYVPMPNVELPKGWESGGGIQLSAFNAHFAGCHARSL